MQGFWAGLLGWWGQHGDIQEGFPLSSSPKTNLLPSLDSWHTPEQGRGEMKLFHQSTARLMTNSRAGESHRAGGCTAREERKRKAEGEERDGMKETHPGSCKHPSGNSRNPSCSEPALRATREKPTTAGGSCRATHPWFWIPSWTLPEPNPSSGEGQRKMPGWHSHTNPLTPTPEPPGKAFPCCSISGQLKKLPGQVQCLQSTAVTYPGWSLCGNSFWSSLILMP